MPSPITASLLYDLIQCPHRPWMDLFGDQTKRDPESAFVKLLWEKGTLYEDEVISKLVPPPLDLSSYPDSERERRTMDAMERGAPLIYSGRIAADDLLGEPDLLRREDSGYVAGDIKSGAAEEGPEDEAKPKKHYAVQLALYTDILERLGKSTGNRKAFVWDIHGKEVIYDLPAPVGRRDPVTLWEIYQETLAQARSIVSQDEKTLPAYGAVCKLCHWHTACLEELTARDDLTLLPELGRSKRDVLMTQLRTVDDLARCDPTVFLTGTKTIFPGIGPETLTKFYERAKLAKSPSPRPYRKEPIELPSAEIEVFFDIEVDPMRDHCYLHGFVERDEGSHPAERYHAFFTADLTSEEEERAFREAWRFLSWRSGCPIYYYSKYERTIWRRLQQKFPSVCSPEEIEALFGSPLMIDLYEIVRKKTEWPTRDFSIKTLAKHCGFAWRDTHPSGAASIEWFDQWVKTGDLAVKQRILDYNEDDCKATRVVVDTVRTMPVQNAG